jgi:hypothetical protein
MLCTYCNSSEFYEDDHGNYVCKICATQSQDYIAESYEMEDNQGFVNLGKRKSIRTLKNKHVNKI